MTVPDTQPATTWQSPTADVAAFLAEFDRRTADPAGDASDQFAENFLALDPNNAMALTPAILAAALPARRGLFRDAGVGAVRRRATRQLDLDPRHLLVTAQWDGERQGRPPVRLESTFLLRRDPAGIRILVYLNHHDLASLLAEPDGAA